MDFVHPYRPTDIRFREKTRVGRTIRKIAYVQNVYHRTKAHPAMIDFLSVHREELCLVVHSIVFRIVDYFPNLRFVEFANESIVKEMTAKKNDTHFMGSYMRIESMSRTSLKNPEPLLQRFQARSTR